MSRLKTWQISCPKPKPITALEHHSRLGPTLSSMRPPAAGSSVTNPVQGEVFANITRYRAHFPVAVLDFVGRATVPRRTAEDAYDRHKCWQRLFSTTRACVLADTHVRTTPHNQVRLNDVNFVSSCHCPFQLYFFVRVSLLILRCLLVYLLVVTLRFLGIECETSAHGPKRRTRSLVSDAVRYVCVSP